MAGNDNRRRKKLEAKRAKKKEQQRSIARIESSGLAGKMSVARSWPLIASQITPDWERRGIANVLLARRGPHDQIAAAVFLIDLKCLGAKDALTFVGSEVSWKIRLRQQQEKGMQFVDTSPEFARKMVEGAVAFARSYGIAPHRDYLRAEPIFGDIDATKCESEIEYGENGKPLFISGPFDTPERIRKILDLLATKAGDGNYHYLLQASEAELLGFEVDEEDFEDEEEDEDEIIEELDQRGIQVIPIEDKS